MNHSLTHQRGAALLVALIILVMVTLMAVSASRFTLLSTRTSMNFQLKNTAFQSAEAGVRQGVSFIASGAANAYFFVNSGAESYTQVGSHLDQGEFPSSISYQIQRPRRVPDQGDSLGEGKGLPKKYRYALVSTATVTGHGVRSSIEQGASEEIIGD